MSSRSDREGTLKTWHDDHSFETEGREEFAEREHLQHLIHAELPLQNLEHHDDQVSLHW